MALIDIKHTFAALDKVQSGLKKIIFFISCISMVLFTGYYTYLIITNVNHLLYLIVYSVLCAVVITSFILELVFKQKKSDTRKQAREKIEKKRIASRTVRIIKCIAKSITITVAIIEMVQNPELELSIILNVVSMFALFLQILFEIFIHFVYKYMDYMKLGFQLDYDNSLVLKFKDVKQFAKETLESINAGRDEEDKYTEQEVKIMSILKEHASKIKQAKDENNNEAIKQEIGKMVGNAKQGFSVFFNKLFHKKEEIIDVVPDKELSRKEKKQLKKEYEKSKKEAEDLIQEPDKVDKLLMKAEAKLKDLPEAFNELRYIPEFISLVKHYFQKKYTDVPKSIITILLVVLIYFVSPLNLPTFIDEVVVVKKCLDMVKGEVDKFIEWRDKNTLIVK